MERKSFYGDIFAAITAVLISHTKQSLLVLVLVLTVVLGVHLPVWSAGFSLFQQGTAANAQGNAFVADASDPSAIFYNPAGLTQLKRPEVYVGTTFLSPDREYTNDSLGHFSQTKHQIYHPVTFYLVVPVHDRVTLGLGLFSPFGLATVWPADWPGKYLTTESKLQTYNLNPTVAVKVLDNLSLGAGVNICWATFRLKRRIPLPYPLPAVSSMILDGKSDLGGDGTGWGFNFGALYEPLPGVKLGAHYRSHIYIRLFGELNTGLPASFPAVFPLPTIPIPNLTPSVSGYGDLTLPPNVTFGINISRFKPFSFEFDATWTGWSTYDKFELNLNQPIRVNNIPTTTIVNPKNWRDVWAFRFGVNYEIREGLKLRGGYIYDISPVPKDTFDTQMPDANRHIFSIGGDWQINRFTLGIAYSFFVIEPRHKDNLLLTNGAPAVPVSIPWSYQVNGLYQSSVHSLGVSLSCHF